MKKILLSFALLLCVSSVFGQDARKLVAKWKTTEGAEFVVTTEDSRKGIEENKKNEAYGMSKECYDYVLKNFKRSSELRLMLNEKEKQQLDADLKSMKGYEMLFSQNNNEGTEQKEATLDQVNKAINPNYQLRVYGKVKDNIVSEILCRCDVYNVVILAYFDVKTKKDSMLDMIFKGYKLATFEVTKEERIN